MKPVWFEEWSVQDRSIWLEETAIAFRLVGALRVGGALGVDVGPGVGVGVGGGVGVGAPPT